MSEIINWLKSKRALVLTLTLYGDPTYHLDYFKETNSASDAIAPFQQWIFSNPEEAQQAAQGICSAIMKKGSEHGSTIVITPREDISKSSRDIVMCLEISDKHDDSTQYRLYVTAFEQKTFGDWI